VLRAFRLILLNLASGPGTEPDLAFAPTVERLHSAGVPIAGYVDTNYTSAPRLKSSTISNGTSTGTACPVSSSTAWRLAPKTSVITPT